MLNTYTIGQLGQLTGVPTSTIRFYERKRLLTPDARTGANYRTYSRQSVERLSFIRAAQAAGFRLKDVREMLALTQSDDPPCADVASLIKRRLDDVRQRLHELQRVEQALADSLKTCCQGGPDWCERIEQLKGRPSAACARIKQKCAARKRSNKSCLTLN